MIINQQRAHIRILFDRYMAQIENRKNASQRMLFPDMVHFSPSEVPVLEEFMDDLNALGFDLSSLGGGTYSINGIPAGIEGLNPEKLVTDMVQTAIEKGCKVKEEVQNMLALSLAKAAAIVPGQVLTDEEMNRLVDDLFAVSTPNYTPDGKTILAVLKEDDLEKMFNDRNSTNNTMCNPGSLKRVIRIFYLYALILDFIFCNKPGFYLSESLKKENLNSSSSFMNNRVSA